jgi:hypothetical protein
MAFIWLGSGGDVLAIKLTSGSSATSRQSG